MKSRTISLAAIVVTAATASCGGEDSPASPAPAPTNTTPTLPTTPVQQPNVPQGNSQSKQYFIDTVYPSLQRTCGGCHINGGSGAPQWLGADANSAYDLIKSYKGGLLAGPVSANLLLLKEPHQGGQQLDNQQKGIVQQWLALEYNGEDDAPGLTFSQALENFAGCMNFGDWQGRNLDQLPQVPVAVDGVDVQAADCTLCHLDAARAGSLFLSADDARATFDGFKLFPSIVKLVTASGFPFKQLVASNRLVEKGDEYRNCVVDNDLLDLVQRGDLNNPDYCHPNYQVDGDAEDQLRFFTTNTIAIAKNGSCAVQGQ